MFENILFVLDVIVFVILSIAWFFLPAFEFSKPEPEIEGLTPLPTRKEHKKEFDFIDNQLLKAQSYTINGDVKFGSAYIIDGLVFKETVKVTNKYKEFEVYSLKMGDYADTSGVSIEDDTNLQLSIQYVPNGVIINSNVYLTYNQWNTLYAVTEENRRCAVCDMACDVTEHVASSIHRANMERYRPANKYDLSITRKINNNYHCGVCNALFEQTKKDEHFMSKEHEDKQLFAINKVSDIMYDFNIHSNNNNLDDKKETYHFNAKAINNNNLDISSEESEDEYEYEDQYDYDKWNPFNSKFQDNYNNDDYYYEEPPQNLANSYASMARKPKTDDLPEVLEIDLGNKKATVKFDSWNMVNRTKRRNLFYCMACKMYEHVRLKAEHCRGEAHVARLEAIPVVDSYEKYLVRQVNDKLYHCGHCNNLQLIHEMEDHIESEHPASNQTHLFDSPAKKLSTPVKTRNTLKTDPNNDVANEANKVLTNVVANNDIVANNDVIVANNDVVAHAYANDAHSNDVANNHVRNDKAITTNNYITQLHNEAGMFDGIRSANSNFDDIVICAYGSKIRISKIAFNMICQGEHDFYCGVCEVNITMDKLKIHLNDLQHLTRLHRTPFIEAFNVHLFREIRDALHCALCNELVQLVPEMILKHKILEKHIVKFNRAVTNDNVIAEAKPAATNVTNGATNTKPAAVNAKQTANYNMNVATNVTKTVNSVVTTAIKKDAPIANKNVAPISNNLNGANATKTANNVINAPITNKNVAPNTNNLNSVTNAAKTTNSVTNEAKKDKPITNKNVALNNIPKEAINKDLPPNNHNNKYAINKVEETKSAKEPIDEDILDAYITAAVNEEFVVVKNGVKEEIAEDLDESFTEEFDYEEYVYVRLGNTYIKITNAAYNTLVSVGDGGRYCFVCSTVVDTTLTAHIESRGHMESMEKFKFVDKYNEDLLRQFYLMYHCSICNIVVTRKHLSHHLTWPTHVLQRDNTKISAKKRKSEIKNGTKHITVAAEKENIYLNEKESDIKIYLNIAIEKGALRVERKNKIVIFNDNVLKVGFDCWHSLSESADGYKCKMCQCDFEEKELGVHVSSEWHKALLEKIDKHYSPALIRKINDATLNCMMCNSEIANNKNSVTEHIQGKKHLRQYDNMLKDSSGTNSYADCDQDVLML